MKMMSLWHRCVSPHRWLTRSCKGGWGIAAWILLHVSPSLAHEINTSYSVLSIRTDEVRLVLSVDETDLVRLDPQIDVNGDGLVYRDEVTGGGEAVA